MKGKSWPRIFPGFAYREISSQSYFPRFGMPGICWRWNSNDGFRPRQISMKITLIIHFNLLWKTGIHSTKRYISIKYKSIVNSFLLEDIEKSSTCEFIYKIWVHTWKSFVPRILCSCLFNWNGTVNDRLIDILEIRPWCHGFASLERKRRKPDSNS